MKKVLSNFKLNLFFFLFHSLEFESTYRRKLKLQDYKIISINTSYGISYFIVEVIEFCPTYWQ